MATTIFGGIGLFLLGMVLLTDGLKAAAGDTLRGLLSRFTGGPVSAVLSGAAVTALVQSSSATTLATIGFVSAGLLTLTQAIGLIFGANLGTTSTGWLVSLLGLKMNISVVAMPVIGVGALTRLLTRGRKASMGLALAGFGLIFVGIDTLQLGMRDLAERIDLSAIGASGVAGTLILVLAGAAMTVVMQSSSAAVATTLTALHSGTIDFRQAAILVIGQNVGTTVTAALAAVGASVTAKRTAVAHILFNALTGVVALSGLPLLLRISTEVSEWLGPAVGIAAFHTAFNLLGVMLLLPFVEPFSRLLKRLVPADGPTLTRNLDDTVADIPAMAVDAARRTAIEIGALLTRVALRVLREEDRPSRVERLLDHAEAAILETRTFLGRIRTSPGFPEYAPHISTLHAIDHLDRLQEALREENHPTAIAADGRLRLIAAGVAERLEPVSAWLKDPESEAPIENARRLSAAIVGTRTVQRIQTLERTARGEVPAESALERLDAMRWIDRIAYHAWRAIHHLGGAGAEEVRQTAESYEEREWWPAAAE